MDLFEKFVENADSIFLHLNAKGSVTYANSAVEKQLGFPRNKLIGKPVSILCSVSGKIMEVVNSEKVGVDISTPVTLNNNTGGSIEFFVRILQDLDNFGNILGYFVTSLANPDKAMIEENLGENSKKLQLALENSKLTLWDWKLTEKSYDFFGGYTKILKYPPDGYKPKFKIWEELVHPEDAMEAKELMLAHFEGLTPYYEAEYRVKNSDGGYIWISDRGKFVERDENDVPTRAIGTHKDITEIYEKNQVLRESLELYRTLVETSRDLIFMLSLEGEILYVNQEIRQYADSDPEYLLGRNISMILDPEGSQRLPKIFSTLKEGKSVENVVVKGNIPPNSPSYPFDINAAPIKNSEGNVEAFLVIARDIHIQQDYKDELETRARDLEALTESLQTSLREKEVLLKEVHHRVKNNLQIISAITLMHEKSASDEKTMFIFKDFQQRIKSMAKIHETLYRSDDLENIRVKPYLNGLINNLIRTYDVDTSRIKILQDLVDIKINLNKAMHFGLIINELVSNSLKYAFPLGKEGKISIRILEKNSDKIRLVISDNGVGIIDGIDLDKTPTMGVKIVKTSTKQLKGTIAVETKGGVTWTMEFPWQELE